MTDPTPTQLRAALAWPTGERPRRFTRKRQTRSKPNDQAQKLPLWKRLRWEGSEWLRSAKLAEVSVNVSVRRGGIYVVTSGGYRAEFTAPTLDAAKRKAVAQVQRWVKRAAKEWEVG